MKPKMENYRSKDLYESAFLYASNKKLLNTEKEENRTWFNFEDKDACEKLSTAYWDKTAQVGAKAFADALRTLKDLIFNR